MKTLRVSQKGVVEKIKKALEKGEVIVFPSDTVYGLLCDAKNKKAVERIFRIKKRPKAKPLAVFVKDIEMLEAFAEINEKQKRFLGKILPGKVTVVLKAKSKVDLTQGIVSSEGTIGFRIPDCPLVNNLLSQFNSPVAQTSANISGSSPLLKIGEVLKEFERAKTKPNLVLDGGDLRKAQPSTVIDLTDIQPKILRKGKIRKQEVMKIIKSIK